MNELPTGVRPLEDVIVLDLTIALAGPFMTLILAGLGAKIIKVENPAGGDSCRGNAPYLGRDGATLVQNHQDDISISALNRLRNKQSVTLNLKHPQGKEVLADLLKKSDVLAENFSLGTLDRLGAGYEFARQINPRIIHCSLTGFGAGSTGPGKAMDTIIQALSGMMLTSGNPADPPIRAGVPFADMITPLFGVIGVLSALQQRHRTGLGQYVDVSMLGALTSLVAAEPFDVLEQLGVPIRTGPTVPRLAPFGVYPVKGGYVAICAPMENFAAALFQAMERPDLAKDDRFKNRDQRVRHVNELDSIIGSWTSTFSLADLLSKLAAHGVPSAPVRGPGEAVRDPQVLKRGDTVPLAHPRYGQVADVYGFGLPIQFSDAVTGFDRDAPGLGADTDTIYSEFLGYSLERIAQLRSDGVI